MGGLLSVQASSQAEQQKANKLSESATNDATPDFALMGFASVPGYGVQTTTGGGEAAPTMVRTAKEFQAVVERLDIRNKDLRDNTPRVVLVEGDIDLGELANEKAGAQIKLVGTVQVRSNTTIYATGEGATLRHGILDVKGAHNVIIRNLCFRDLWEEDPSGNYDSLGWDYVRITNSGQTKSHHVWIDRCDFGKVYDGQLDITHGSDLVTVSWCHFAGDERGAQKKVSLIGHSSSANAAATDKGRLNVTFHHNWFENLDDRTPRARFGNIHFFNNFVDGAENATMSVTGAVTLVEKSVYRDTRVATSFSHDKDSVSKDRGGTICIVDSRNEAPRPAKSSDDSVDKDKQFEIEHNFQSSVSRENLHFNASLGFEWHNLNSLPYSYRVDSVEQVPALVTKYAGMGKL
jgi:pectate lyase